MALLYSGSLLTRDEAEAALGQVPGTLDPATNSPPDMMVIIKGVEGAMKNDAGRQFVETTHTDLCVLRRPSDFVRLKDFPVIEFTSFERVGAVDDQGAVDPTSLTEFSKKLYTVDTEMGFLETVNGCFPTGRVLLTYKTGFSVADIENGADPDVATFKEIALRNIRRNWLNFSKTGNLHTNDGEIVRGFTSEDRDLLQSITAPPRFC